MLITLNQDFIEKVVLAFKTVRDHDMGGNGVLTAGNGPDVQVIDAADAVMVTTTLVAKTCCESGEIPS